MAAEGDFAEGKKGQPDENYNNDQTYSHGHAGVEVEQHETQDKDLERELATGCKCMAFAGADEPLVEMFAMSLMPLITASDPSNEGDGGVQHEIGMKQSERDEQPPARNPGQPNNQDPQQETQWRTPDIAHEHAGAGEVVREEPERRTGKGQTQQYGCAGEITEG